MGEPRGAMKPDLYPEPPGRHDVATREAPRTRPRKTALIIAGHLVDRIADEGLQPGDVLPPERLLMEQYDVGRGTMREALRYLELQGVLTIKPGPNGGPVVATPDSRHLASSFALLMQSAGTDFRAVIEARTLLEPTTAFLAASQGDPAVGERLLASVDAMEARLDDWQFFLDENRRFHHLVAWASRNPIFGYLINSLQWVTDGTVFGIDYPLASRRIVLEAHRTIADAVAAADPGASEKAMRRHLEDTLRYLEKRYPKVLEQRLRWEHHGGS
jgi:GntR family transcriptional regulator, transcriptional repressor for pyruvate dehydrogenase complex